MKTMSRITPILMILVMMFPVGVLAGRKHKDMENIGNRKINGRIAGIFPNFISLEHLSILLLETPSLNNAQYTKQTSNLESLAHDESLQMLYVVACQREEYAHGYHTSVRVAQALSGSKATFRVRLLDKRGFVLHESLEPISAETLRAWAEAPSP